MRTKRSWLLINLLAIGGAALFIANFLRYDKSMSESPNEKELEAHVNRLVGAINNTYLNRKTILWNSFLGGLFSGLGATIGVAIIVALLGFLIRKLGGLPVIGSWLIDIGKVLPTKH